MLRTTPHLRQAGKGDGHEEGSTARRARRSRRSHGRPRGARRRGPSAGCGGIEPPRGAADRGRPGRRQHGRLRVRQPRRRPTPSRSSPTTSRSRSRPAARTSTAFGPTRAATRSTSTTTATPSDDVDLRVPVQDDGRQPEHVPLQHGSGRVARRREPERQADVLGDAGHAGRRASVLVDGRDRSRPPNVGPRSTPNYDALAAAASSRRSAADARSFAGPRDDPFFVDLGSIFDLAGLRPFNSAHLHPAAGRGGRGRRAGLQHAHDRDPGAEDATSWLRPTADGIIGVYASASRQKIRILRGDGSSDSEGPWVQVSRLGNPLVNEVVIPLGKKDYWNASSPRERLAVPEPLPLARAGVAREPPVSGAAGHRDGRARRPGRRAPDRRQAPGRDTVHVHRRSKGGPAAAQHRRTADGVAGAGSASSQATCRASRTAAASATT